MDFLNNPQVHVRDEERVLEVIYQLIRDGPAKLQIIADFDRTLSKYVHNGELCSTCHNVLEEGYLPDTFKEKARVLRAKYFPIETNPNLTAEEKIPKMIEWWQKSHELLESCGLSKETIQQCVARSKARLRDGCVMFFDKLKKHDVPVLIFSAGIGDVIEEIIKQQATMHDNMHIVSNYMKYDENGMMIGFQDEMIHTYNKNENAFQDSDYFRNIEHRDNIILIGDTIGDLHMADGAEVDNKLTIGFLNTRVNESLELFKEKFDIVLVEDETMEIPNSLLQCILVR